MNEEDCIPHEYYWIEVDGDLVVAQFFGMSWRACCWDDDVLIYDPNETPTYFRFTRFHKIISHIERPTNV